MKKIAKTIFSVLAIIVLFLIISNLLQILIGGWNFLPCRTASVVPPFTSPTGPYDKFCSIGQMIGAIRDYQQPYYALFWIAFYIICIALSFLIVYLVKKVLTKGRRMR